MRDIPCTQVFSASPPTLRIIQTREGEDEEYKSLLSEFKARMKTIVLAANYKTKFSGISFAIRTD